MFDKVEQMALKIEGMTCGHCQKRVEEALKAVKGVKGVQVSLVGKTAEIRYAAGKTDRAGLGEGRDRCRLYGDGLNRWGRIAIWKTSGIPVRSSCRSAG